MTAQLVVDIVTDASKAIAGFKKVDQAASNTATKTGSAGSKIATLAKAVATGYAVEKVVDFGRESVNAAESAQVANQRLEAMFKKTGDTTGEAAKHAEELAESFGKQIGVSPEVIKGAEGILTAFHSVSDATGRQAGLFDGATKAAADLAAAGFGNVTDNAKTLGKALSDPAKGMGVLRKSGVVLTAAQQTQIKTMEKQGNLLGAQKALLGDVNQSVGGTAAATATGSAKMKVAWEEAQVNIGAKLLPAVQKIQTTIAGVIGYVSANTGWLVPLVGGVLAFVAAIKIITTVTKLWKDAQLILNAVMDLNPITLIILAIAAIVVIIVVLWNKCSAFRDFFKAVWRDILGAVKVVWNWLKSNWPYVLGILLGPIALAAAAIYKNWGTIKAGALAVWNWLKSTWASVYSFITAPISKAISWAETAFGGMVSFLTGIPGKVGRALAGVFQAVIYPFEMAWGWIQDNILGPLKSAWNAIARTVNAVHIKTPGVKVANHTLIPSIDWRPPFRLPLLAGGGVFDRATMAVVGEAGREVVAPESLLRSIVGQGSKETNVTINVYVPPTANPAETGRAVADSLRSFFRAGGRLAVPA